MVQVLPADIRGLLVDHAQRANLLEVSYPPLAPPENPAVTLFEP